MSVKGIMHFPDSSESGAGDSDGQKNNGTLNSLPDMRTINTAEKKLLLPIHVYALSTPLASLHISSATLQQHFILLNN